MDHAAPHCERASFDADPGSVRRARAFVASRAAGLVPAPLVGDLVLVADELATNAVAHAGTAFTVSIRRMDGTIRVVVTDGSSRLPEQRPPSSDLETGGRGLAIVAALSRHWGVDPEPDGAKSVWAAFDAREPAEART